jgi:polyketide cyclase/dehydrase/lipid transport protein
MIEFETTVRIGRTPGQVFSVLADFETYLARWAKGPVAAARTDGDGGAGSHYTITARAGPGTVQSPSEVTGYDPPSRFAGHGIAGPVRFHEEYRLTQDGTATILTQSIRATPRGPFRLAAGLLARQLQRLIASDLGRLKDLVEAEAPQT